jgi:hypothetical protein
VYRLQLLMALAGAVNLESEPHGTHDHIFTVSDSRLPQPGRPGSRIYVTAEAFESASTRGNPCHSQWYFTGRFTASQFVLATSALRLTTSNFIFRLNICGYSPYVTSSLTRGWVCRLQLLLVLASAVILRFESRGTHDHI